MHILTKVKIFVNSCYFQILFRPWFVLEVRVDQHHVDQVEVLSGFDGGEAGVGLKQVFAQVIDLRHNEEHALGVSELFVFIDRLVLAHRLPV